MHTPCYPLAPPLPHPPSHMPTWGAPLVCIRCYLAMNNSPATNHAIDSVVPLTVVQVAPLIYSPPPSTPFCARTEPCIDTRTSVASVPPVVTA